MCCAAEEGQEGHEEGQEGHEEGGEVHEGQDENEGLEVHEGLEVPLGRSPVQVDVGEEVVACISLNGVSTSSTSSTSTSQFRSAGCTLSPVLAPALCTPALIPVFVSVSAL